MVKRTPSRPWCVYILECAKDRLYTGITNNLQRRFAQHQAGKGAKFTRSYPPLGILASQSCKNRSDASKLEYAIKQLQPEQKRALAATWGST